MPLWIGPWPTHVHKTRAAMAMSPSMSQPMQPFFSAGSFSAIAKNILRCFVHARPAMISLQQARRFLGRDEAEISRVARGDAVLQAEQRGRARGEGGPHVLEEKSAHSLRA